MKYALFFALIMLFGCNGKLTRRDCELDFFEKTSNILFPKNIAIINCEDDLEGDIWIHLRFSKTDINEFIEKMDFHSYSDEPEYLENDTTKISPFYFDDEAVEYFETYMNNDYVEIPKTDFTYIATISKEKQYVTYILNIKSGLFWGHISYPDWSGDF